MPNDDVENTIGPNKEGILRFMISHGLVSESHKGTRFAEEILYIEEHILSESKTRQKSSYGENWLHKGLRYGTSKVNTNKLYRKKISTT